MPTFVDAKADGFVSARAIVMPVMDGLEFANFYGGASDPERNLAPGKDRAIMRGDPTSLGGDFFIRCEGMVNWIDLPVQALPEFTFICVAKAVLPDAGSIPLISNIGSAAQEGSGLSGANMYLNDAAAGNNMLRLTTLQPVNNNGTSTNVAASTLHFNASTAGWQMFTGRSIAAGDVISKVMGSALAPAVTPNAYEPILAQPYRLGSQYNANAKGKVDIAAAMIFSRALSDAELDQEYAFTRRLLARRGITI